MMAMAKEITRLKYRMSSFQERAEMIRRDDPKEIFIFQSDLRNPREIEAVSEDLRDILRAHKVKSANFQYEVKE